MVKPWGLTTISIWRAREAQDEENNFLFCHSQQLQFHSSSYILQVWEGILIFCLSGLTGFPPSSVSFRIRAERFSNSPYLLPFSFRIGQRERILINRQKHVSLNSWTSVSSLLAEKNKKKRNKPCPTYMDSSLHLPIQRALHTCKTAFHLLHQGHTEESATRAALNTIRNPFFCWVDVLLTHLVPLVCSQNHCVFLYCSHVQSLHFYMLLMKASICFSF